MSTAIIYPKGFSKALQKAAWDLGDQAAPMVAAASSVRQSAQSAAPRRSGALAGSLVQSADRISADVGTTIVYANPIHWGWKARNIAANRFLTDSARAAESQWIGNFERFMEDIVNGVEGTYR